MKVLWIGGSQLALEAREPACSGLNVRLAAYEVARLNARQALSLVALACRLACGQGFAQATACSVTIAGAVRLSCPGCCDFGRACCFALS